MKYLPLAVALGLLVAACQPAIAQPAGSFLTFWNAGGDGTGSGNWNTASNWNPSSVPDSASDDFAIINGGGVATISSASPDAGGLFLGQVFATSGTLSVVPGGSINFVEIPGFPGDGGVRVGNVGTGTLEMTGGNLTAAWITSGGNAASLISLSGTSTISVGSASLNQTTQITGADVDFSTGGALVFSDFHELIAGITGPTHSTIEVGTAATLRGALSVDFSGYAPSATDTWDLLSAPAVGGNFASVTQTGATLGAGQAVAVRTVPDGSDELVQLFIQQQLVLDVDRGTGQVSISNPGSVSVDFDGYSVQSALGGLTAGGWNTLATQLGSGWTEANPSATNLNEIIDGASSSTVTGGSSLAIGAVFDPVPPTEFGTEIEDLAFQYTTPESGEISATVNYFGAGVINDLVLYVDPSTGEATMRNTSPFNVEIEAYTVTSESGSLDPVGWDSLEDQGAESGAWEEANPTSERVTELMNAGETEMSIHRTFELGELVLGGTEDIVFEYLLAGEETSRTGVVVYGAAPAEAALPGDYNNDGTVDAADYTVYRDALGTPTSLPNDTSPGGVLSIDYAVWASNFGRSLPGGLAVPEPGSLVFMIFASLTSAGVGTRCRN